MDKLDEYNRQWVLLQRRLSVEENNRRMSRARKFPRVFSRESDEAPELFMNYWHTGDVNLLAQLVQRHGNNWPVISHEMPGPWDQNRPAHWFTDKRCALMYKRFLSKFENRKRNTCFKDPDTAEELLVKSLVAMRLFALKGETDSIRILSCRIQSIMDMIVHGEVDHELDILINSVDNFKEAFGDSYGRWLTSLDENPSLGKGSPTKGKASSPRSEEGKQQTASSENAEHAGVSGIGPFSPRPGTLPPFFNPSSALASAAARQLAAFTAALIQRKHLLINRCTEVDGNVTATTTPPVSTVSSVTLSAPTLSKLLEMPPSVPGKLPPLPTAFYSSDCLPLSGVSSTSKTQTPDTSHSSPMKTDANNQTDDSKHNEEKISVMTESVLNTKKETEAVIDVISPKNSAEESMEKEKAPLSEKSPFRVSSEVENISDSTIQFQPHISNNNQGTVEKISCESQKNVSLVVGDDNEKDKSVHGKENPKDPSLEVYICSTSESEDSSCDNKTEKIKTDTKEIPKSVPIGRKRSRKQTYTERSCSGFDDFDSSEDSESVKRGKVDKSCDLSHNRTTVENSPDITIIDNDIKKAEDTDSSKTMIFDSNNICQSPSEAINFLKQLDNMEKRNVSSLSSLECSSSTSDLSTRPITSPTKSTNKDSFSFSREKVTQSSILSENISCDIDSDSFSQTLSNIISSPMKSSPPKNALPTTLSSSIKYCEQANAKSAEVSSSSTESASNKAPVSISSVTDDTEMSNEILTRSPDSMNSSTNKTVDSAFSPERSPSASSKSHSVVSLDSSPNTNIESDVSKSLCDDDIEIISQNEMKNSSESLDVFKNIESSQDTCSVSSEEKESVLLTNFTEKQKDSSKSPRKQSPKSPRRGRRGGRTTFPKKFFEPSPSSGDSYSTPDILKEHKAETSKTERIFSDKDIKSQIPDSDEDTISDKGSFEPIKSRTVSRYPGRSGRRGRRGRGRARRVITDFDDCTSDDRNSTTSSLKTELLEEDEETRTEIEEYNDNEQSDSQKKESDSTTIEDSGASSQNSEKDFFRSSISKNKEYDDADGESDTDGNDSQERKVPSESTDEADDSLIKSLSEEKPIDINDYSSTSPASTLASEYLFSKCSNDDKDDLYSRQWSPQSSAQTSQSAVTPPSTDSSDETENSDDSEETDQTANSNENSDSTQKKAKRKECLHAYKAWKKAICILWREASCHKYANVFLQPVTDDVAPGYQSIVHRPMDLTTIKKNIDNGTIRTTERFQRDMMLMFQNAIMYNSSDHHVFQMAREMQRDVHRQIQDFLAAQLILPDENKDTSVATHLRTARQIKAQGKSQRSINSKNP